MIGLMLLGAGALYFGLMFFVMRGAWRGVRADGGSMLAASTFAFVGFLLVYLPVFWNHIPVLLAHRSMCAKDAGFKAHVTPEQWIAQNKDAIGKLTKQFVQEQERISKSVELSNGFWRELYFGGLLATERKGSTHLVLSIDISKGEDRVRDANTGQLLATYIDYSASRNPDDIRGWIFPSHCPYAAGNNPRDKYFQFRSDLTKEIK